MISIGDALQQSAAYNRQEANAQAFIKASQEIETSCAACLKGLRPGRKPNGFYVARPETAESCEVIAACPNRLTCEKLLGFDDERIERVKKNSGMSEELLTKTVNGFLAEGEYQKAAKTMAASYITSALEKYKKFETPSWLYLGGQSGCGKTHLCAAASNAFLNKGRSVKYCSYTDLSRAIGTFDYDRLEEIKKARILFLDDLFKIEPNAGEMKAVFDLIDYRYRYNMQTIISSEKKLDEIEMIDAAIAGRIMERCGIFFMGINKDERKNFRKGGMAKC